MIFVFQTMVIVLLESSMLLLEDRERLNIHTAKEKLENKEMDIHVHMVKLDVFNQNNDFDKQIYKGRAENNLVSDS